MIDDENEISIVWHIEDVQSVRPDLNDVEARDVLAFVKDKHDANYGVSWETIEGAADYLYPTSPEVA